MHWWCWSTGETPLSHPKAKEKFISEDATWKEKDDTCDHEGYWGCEGQEEHTGRPLPELLEGSTMKRIALVQESPPLQIV